MSVIVGVLLAIGGGVWMAQGLNLPWAPGSFMTGDPLWVVIGAATVAVGLILVARAAVRRAKPNGSDDGS